MNLSSILKFGTKALGRGSLYAQKYSPELLTTVGVVGIVASAILASRATLKLEGVLHEGSERLETAHFLRDEHGDQKAVVKAYARNSFEIVKLYGPPVTLGALSIVCVIGAQGILRKRIVALTAAYKSLETAYSAYRERVSDRYGEEAERSIFYDLHEVENVDPETGKKTKALEPLDPMKTSVHARWFDKDNPNWSVSYEDNLSFLQMQQNYHNHVLQSRGHVLLNDVYESLGFERTSEGAILGWVSGAQSEGDDFIDFGFYSLIDSGTRTNRAILMDFNIDGIVWDKIS